MKKVLKIAQNVLFTVFLVVFYPILLLLTVGATLIRFREFGTVKECNGIMADTLKTIWKALMIVQTPHRTTVPIPVPAANKTSTMSESVKPEPLRTLANQPMIPTRHTIKIGSVVLVSPL